MIEPTIFVGPPGTGKTTVLLDTVDREMESGVAPDKIGFMTFTKRGVEEAVTRASTRFNLPRKDFRYFNTLHSAAFRHMGLSSSQVFTGKKVQEFGAEYGLTLNGSVSSEDGFYSNFEGDDIVLFLENYARITGQHIGNVLSMYDTIVPDMDRSWRIIKHLREYKKREGLYDFTDMLEEFIKLNDPPRLDVLIIDEAQDLSELQWAMIAVLARYVKRIYIAGDDDQTIFTWAGASERFISMPGNVTVLDQSYRVPIVVQKVANSIISQVVHRRPKEWNPRDARGTYQTIESIGRLDPYMMDKDNGSVMMLGRTVKMLRQRLIPYCRMHGLLYRYFEANSIKPTQAEAISAWDDLYKNIAVSADRIVRIYDLLPADTHKKKGGYTRGSKASLKRIADQPDPPKFTMQNLRDDYGLLAQGEWYQALTGIDQRDVDYIKKVMSNGYSLLDKPNIHISTIHRVKGGEADTVVLLSDQAKAQNDRFIAANQDEEHRVFYTGVTRTFEDLIVVQPDKRYHYGRLFE